jgi:hypothetical protein
MYINIHIHIHVMYKLYYLLFILMYTSTIPSEIHIQQGAFGGQQREEAAAYESKIES